MPPVDLEGLRETFEAIDKSHSGTISLEELTTHLQVKLFPVKTYTASIGQIDQIDHDLDHLDPHLPL